MSVSKNIHYSYGAVIPTIQNFISNYLGYCKYYRLLMLYCLFLLFMYKMNITP